MPESSSSDGLMREVGGFPLLKALFGRRSRRFARGIELPGGPLAFKSRHAPVPLSELEQALLLAAANWGQAEEFGL
ncbi:MAG: hypothetical protein ACE5Q6_14310 [Dehalococcoidia bacterium]